MFMFAVPKHIAHKMVGKKQLNPAKKDHHHLWQTNLKLTRQNKEINVKYCTNLGSKTPKNDLSILNKGIPDSCTTMSI